MLLISALCSYRDITVVHFFVVANFNMNYYFSYQGFLDPLIHKCVCSISFEALNICPDRLKLFTCAPVCEYMSSLFMIVMLSTSSWQEWDSSLLFQLLEGRG